MKLNGCPWSESYSAAAYMADSVTRLLGESPAFASSKVRRYAHYRGGITFKKPEEESSGQLGIVGSVLGKIAQRGIPAPCSLQLERGILEEAKAAGHLDFTEEKDSGAFVFNCTPNREDLSTILTVCCIPELLLDEKTTNSLLQRYRSLCTDPEKIFFNMLIDQLPDPRFGLLFLPQRSMVSMGIDDHHDERVDFALEVPLNEVHDNSSGWLKIVIEIDDKSHLNNKPKDLTRDIHLKEMGWIVYRFPFKEHDDMAKWPEDISKSDIIKQIQKAIPDKMLIAAENIRSMEPRSREALCNLVALPVAEAQITSAVAQIIYSTGKQSIRISNPQNLSLTPVVSAVQEMVNAITALHTPGKLITLTLAMDSHNDADLIFYGYPSSDAWDDIANQKQMVITHRPVWSEYIEPFLSAKPYEVEINDNVHAAISASLEYFLQNVFRKEKFRPKQLEIIERALTLNHVIGLLPTAAGKSLCYQLPSLLQPGFSFIVDPLRSLMIDQTSGLEAMGIHRCAAFMSGSGQVGTQNAKDRERLYQKLKKREFLFIFNSPERLQIPEFIDLVNSQMVNINYCVVDEAHCVSEWGHDFRLAYMNVWRRMGENNLRKTFIALTGTASQIVLIDIRHILNISNQDAVIEPSTFDRAELNFEIHKVSTVDHIKRITDRVNHLINNSTCVPNKIPSGLIFSNFVGGNVGVCQISEVLKNRFNCDFPVYSGKPCQSEDSKGWDEKKEKLQRKFKNDQIPIMVCTNSFGMGIDKPNIRFTIHTILPKSLEDFYQQSGRAGRDQKESHCILIFIDEEPEYTDNILDPEKTSYDLLLAKVKEKNGILNKISLREDAIRNLWFLSQTFRGKDDERRALYYTIKKILLPNMPPADQYRSIPFSIVDFETRIVNPDNPGSVKNEDQKNVLELALYRCYLCGAIHDYRYDYTGKQFIIDLTSIDSNEMYYRIQTYLSERMIEAEQRVLFKNREKKQSYEEAAYDCGCILIDYIYETIEKRRRRAILHVLQAARDGAEHGQEIFREALLNYLEASEFTQPVKQIVQKDDCQLWLEILSRVRKMDDIALLLGACRRQLEEYPDHPGLLILAGFCEAVSSTPEQGITDISNGFKVFRRFYGEDPSLRYTIAMGVLQNVERVLPSKKLRIRDAIELADPEIFKR